MWIASLPLMVVLLFLFVFSGHALRDAIENSTAGNGSESALAIIIFICCLFAESLLILAISYIWGL